MHLLIASRITGQLTTNAAPGTLNFNTIIAAVPGYSIRVISLYLSLTRFGTGITSISLESNNTGATALVNAVRLEPVAAVFDTRWEFPGHQFANSAFVNLRDVSTVASVQYVYVIRYYLDPQT